MAIHELEVLDVTGHTTKKWDTANKAEMEIVQRLYSDLTKKGYKAFSITKGEGDNATVSEPRGTFDPEAKKMLLVPPIQAG